MVAQHARLRIVQAQRRDVGAHAAAQRRGHRVEQLARVEMRDDGIGHIEQQIELIPLALQNHQEIGQLGVRRQHAGHVDNPGRPLIEDIELITNAFHSTPESQGLIWSLRRKPDQSAGQTSV